MLFSLQGQIRATLLARRFGERRVSSTFARCLARLRRLKHEGAAGYELIYPPGSGLHWSRTVRSVAEMVAVVLAMPRRDLLAIGEHAACFSRDHRSKKLSWSAWSRTYRRSGRPQAQHDCARRGDRDARTA